MRLLLVCVSVLAGCATSGKTKLLSIAFDEPERRQELFEATLRVLDANLEYVDEFFAKAKKHRRTLDRFIEDDTAALDEEQLAARTARHLVAHPAALEMIMEQSMDKASGNPAAKKAIAQAIRARAETAANIMVEDEQSMGAITHALAEKAMHDQNARAQMKRGLDQAWKMK